MKGRWEANKNVWLPFLYSQEWNCAASLFLKQNYNVLSPNSYTHISVRDLYISSIALSSLLRSQTQECRNWDRGGAIPFPRIHKLNFRYSVYYKLVTPLSGTVNINTSCTVLFIDFLWGKTYRKEVLFLWIQKQKDERKLLLIWKRKWDFSGRQVESSLFLDTDRWIHRVHIG